MRGVPRERRAISPPPSSSIGTPRMRAERRTISSMSVVGVEVEPVDDPEARAQRRGQQAGARRRADQRELLQRHLHRPRARALADHDVELVVLHRRIEDLLDRRRQPVDLVDEQHLVLLRGWSASPARSPGFSSTGPAVARTGTPSSLRDDVRQRRLAEPGRAVEQHVIERLARGRARPRSTPAGSRARGPGRCTRRARADAARPRTARPRRRGRRLRTQVAHRSQRTSVASRIRLSHELAQRAACSACSKLARRASLSSAASTAFSASGR